MNNTTTITKFKQMGFVPFFLLAMVFVMPTTAQFTHPKVLMSSRLVDSKSYAVVFDAGSTGSRAHVFSFNQDFDLLPVANGTDFEFFLQVKPGLSAYAENPPAAANSLVPLLDKAESVVPKEFRSNTPVILGATAGLRLLEGNASERIMEAVKDLLRNMSTLKYEADAISILTGFQEGSYMWMAINYLVRNLGKRYSDTVGVVDLGGGSVQMAYAISEADAAKAPRVPDGEDPYIGEFVLKRTRYYLYVHSYLHYGLLAARAESLKVSKNSTNPCILTGYNGVYKYGGKDYKASAPASGTSFKKCRRVALKALKITAPCRYVNCTFSGVWNGGGGDGQKEMYVASYFNQIAKVAGIEDSKAHSGKASPADFLKAARRACQTKFEDAKSRYPKSEEKDLPYICMDLVYQYTLLVDGFGLHPRKNFTLVGLIEYKNSLMEAAWPLGSAIEAVSSSVAGYTA